MRGLIFDNIAPILADLTGKGLIILMIQAIVGAFFRALAERLLRKLWPSA